MKAKKLHYGFVVATGCFLIMFCSMGMAFNLLSLFLSDMVSELGFTQSQASNAMTLQSLTSLLCIFFLGRAYERYSTRRVAAICSLAGVLGYLCFSAGSLAMCYLGAALVGVAHGGAALVPVSIFVTAWFRKYRGVVLSACMVGSSGANVVCSRLVALMLSRWGLARASLCHATAIFLLCAIALLLVRDDPAPMGLLPYGAEDGETPPDATDKALPTTSAEPLRRGAFAAMAAAMCMVGFVITPLNGFYPTFLQSVGYETIFLGTAATVFGVTMIGGKLAVGVIIDTLGLRRASFLLYALPAAALASAIMVTRQPVTALVFVALWGLGNPIGTVPLPLWVQNIFGATRYKLTYSRILAAFTLGSTCGFFMIGKLADLFHSYHVFFSIDILLLIASFAILMRLLKPAKSPHGDGDAT